MSYSNPYEVPVQMDGRDEPSGSGVSGSGGMEVWSYPHPIRDPVRGRYTDTIIRCAPFMHLTCAHKCTLPYNGSISVSYYPTMFMSPFILLILCTIILSSDVLDPEIS